MGYKMKSFPMQSVSALKNKIKEDKFDVDKIADADEEKFLREQREEKVKYSELDEKGKAIYNKLRKKGKI